MTRGMWHLGYRWEFVAFKPYFGQTMSLGRMIDYKQSIAMIKNRRAAQPTTTPKVTRSYNHPCIYIVRHHRSFIFTISSVSISIHSK